MVMNYNAQQADRYFTEPPEELPDEEHEEYLRSLHEDCEKV